MTRTLIAIFSLTFAGCLVSPDSTAGCRAASTCEACIELAGCGWCSGTGCVGGTEAGPDSDPNFGSGSLTCQRDYRWDSCTPREDPCRVHAAAGACGLANGCEWCPSGGCRRFGACPTPTPQPTTRCTNECRHAYDGACDDGGPASEYSLCELGTDCGDCGPRAVFP